ncbi:MAG: ferritin-like domain-containing protein, partial [Planctomycetota bacterium]
IGEDVPDLMKKDLDLEIDAVERLNRLITLFRNEEDNGSAELLGRILADEEAHIDWLENQLALIVSIGLENYLARHFSPGEAE